MNNNYLHMADSTAIHKLRTLVEHGSLNDTLDPSFDNKVWRRLCLAHSKFDQRCRKKGLD
jgi:hypothetical protein